MAGVMRLHGFDVGPNLMPAVEGVNRRGFWEHMDAFEIHERLLAALGRSSFDPRELPHHWRDHPAYAVAVRDVRALIAHDFSGSQRWLVKDARLCKLAPVWFDALRDLDLTPRVLLIVRDPIEVVSSMRALGWGPSPARSFLCWTQYMLDAERVTRGVLRACVTYDDLLTDWRSVMRRIGADLHMDLPNDEETAGRVDTFLDARERHYLERPDRPLDAGRVAPPLTRRLYESYRACGGDGWSRVAAVGSVYSLGEGMFGATVDELIVELSLAQWSLAERSQPTP